MSGKQRDRRCRLHAAMACVAMLLSGSAAAQSVLTALDAGGGPITYYVAEGAPESRYRASDRELAVWALEAWSDAAGGKLELTAAAEEDAIVRIYFVPASAGQYGEMRPIRVGERRGAEVYVRPDMRALGPDIAAAALEDPLLRDTIVYLTCVHELGHAFGLEHTADYADIMYSFQYGGDIPAYFGRYRDRLTSRADIAAVSALSAADVARVAALYADEPAN